MQPAYVYSPEYNFTMPDLGGGESEGNLHRFDSRRAGRAWAELCAGKVLPAEAHLAPMPVTEEQLLAVHTADYLASLRRPEVIADVLDIPALAKLPIEMLDEFLIKRQALSTGGTIVAARHALSSGLAFQLGGGYHHASRDKGDGFCLFSDIGVAIEVMRQEARLERVMVVDLDVHQGNGVGRIFREDDSVAVFDIYNKDIWPGDELAREGIRWEYRIESGTAGGAYLELLKAKLPVAIADFRPQQIFYNAGTDIMSGDPLGLLAVSPDDVLKRDLFVIEVAVQGSIPLIMTPSGGYSDTSYLALANILLEVRKRFE